MASESSRNAHLMLSGQIGGSGIFYSNGVGLSVSPCVYKVGDHFPKIPYKKREAFSSTVPLHGIQFLPVPEDTRGRGRPRVAACGVGGPAVGSVWGGSCCVRSPVPGAQETLLFISLGGHLGLGGEQARYTRDRLPFPLLSVTLTHAKGRQWQEAWVNTHSCIDVMYVISE